MVARLDHQPLRRRTQPPRIDLPVLAISLFFAVAAAQPASAPLGDAPPGVVETIPANGALLDHPPVDVLIRFAEDVNPITGRVEDDFGRTVTPPDAMRALGSILGIWLPPGLPDGRYVAIYSVRFGDSRTAEGSLWFVVRSAP